MQKRAFLPLWSLAIVLASLRQNGQHFANADSFAYDTNRTCRGSSSGLSHKNVGQPWSRYLDYVSMYANCTTVLESLEIVFLDDNYDYDMSFLESIREVRGYVLIFGNYFDFLPLKNLRLIRGRSLYFPSRSKVGYSLYISTNRETNSTSVGLKEMHLTSLHEILDGNVLIENNNLLCHVETINWTDILGDASRVLLKPLLQEQYRRPCEECHPSCTFNVVAHCWGPGSDKCQKITKGLCNSNCEWGCFGSGPHQCCSDQCAGGCRHHRLDCWACRYFVNDGVCVHICPGEMIYNRETYRLEPNPDVRYMYGNVCVRKCPDDMLTETVACVTRCSEGYMADKDRNCRPCRNGVCRKSCPGGIVDMNNVANFSGCTIIDGNLQILQRTFFGLDALVNVSDLDVFESVEEITGFLQIQGHDPDFYTLSFLRNLRVVNGRTRLRYQGDGFSFVISQTDLVELGLTSMKEISSGGMVILSNHRLERLGLESLETVGDGSVLIANNSNLCYVESINWTQIVASQTGKIVLENNANQTTQCEPNGKVCSSQCTSDGCWGPTNEDCRHCTGYRFGLTCVESCQFQKGLYAEEVNGIKQCQRCHKECQESCFGKESNQCNACRKVRDGPYCRAECPKSKYAKASSGACEPCFENCKDGCTGQGTHLGFEGCNACYLFIELKEGTRICKKDDSQCPNNFYRFQGRLDVETENGTKKVRLDWCRQCDDKECQRNFIYKDSTLSTDKYPAVENISMSSIDVTTELSAPNGNNFFFWIAVPLSLAVLASILYHYYISKRISTGLNALRIASLDQPISDEYEIMPYAYTDAYDNIEDVIETDLDAPATQFPMRDGPLPTPGYDSLLPTPSTPTVYYAIDNYEQPMESNCYDVEIIPGHTSEVEHYSDMERSATGEYSDNANSNDPAYIQLLSDEEPVDSADTEINPGHESDSELCSGIDNLVEHLVKDNAKHSTYMQLLNETESAFSPAPLARNEIHRLSIASNNNYDNEIIPSSYLQINEDATEDDSCKEIPSSDLKIGEDVSKEDT